jgi:hypothetical protein
MTFLNDAKRVIISILSVSENHRSFHGFQRQRNSSGIFPTWFKSRPVDATSAFFVLQKSLALTSLVQGTAKSAPPLPSPFGVTDDRHLRGSQTLQMPWPYCKKGKAIMKGKLVDEVTAARIRKAAREGRVEIAPQDKIDDHWQQVDRILHDIGFPEALVTDESCFSNFPLEDADYGRLSRQYGFEVGERDRIAAVAERLASLRR